MLGKSFNICILNSRNRWPLLWNRTSNLGFAEFICRNILFTYLVAHMVKNLPVVQETWVQSLGQGDSLEKGMVTHSSILAWRIPWTEESGGLQFTGSQRVGHDWVTSLHLSHFLLHSSGNLNKKYKTIVQWRNYYSYNTNFPLLKMVSAWWGCSLISNFYMVLNMSQFG